MENKKQIKLYTEEQLRDAIAFGNISRPNITNDDWIKRQTPIELPSDEELEERAERNINPFSFMDGAKWMRDKIKGGENEYKSDKEDQVGKSDRGSRSLYLRGNKLG